MRIQRKLTGPQHQCGSRGLRFFLPFGGLILSLVLSPLIAAGQSASKIVAQYQKTIGGSSLLKGLKTVDIQGHVTAGPDSNGTFTEDLQAPNRIYLEVSLGTHRWSEAYNGKSAWILEPQNGLRTLTGARGKDIQLAGAILNDGLLDYRKQKVKLTVQGREQVSGQDTYVVRATSSSGVERKLWFGAANHLLLKEEVPAFYPPVFGLKPASVTQTGNTHEAGPAFDTILYTGYRPVGGLLEPYQMDVQLGTGTLHIVIDRIRHNASLNSAVFNFPQTSSKPLPDIAPLLRDVEANQKAIDKIVDDYTYHEQDTEFVIDKKGHKIEKSRKTYEVYHLGRHEVQKLIRKDGKPLSPSAQTKEDQRAEKAVKDYQKRQAQRASGQRKPRKNEDHPGISDFLRVDQFTNPRRERYRGQDLIVFDFGPKPGYKPRNTAERFIQGLVGAAWVDEKARDVARLEAHTTKSWKFGGGLVVSLRPGAHFVFEQQRVNGEVWLPSYTEIYVAAKFLLFAGINANFISRFSDYQKFRVETAEKAQKPG